MAETLADYHFLKLAFLASAEAAYVMGLSPGHCSPWTAGRQPTNGDGFEQRVGDVSAGGRPRP